MSVPGRRAFSLIDVLVSMAVIALLIALLLPSLGPVKESARQVVCRSGIRQIGLGIAMYADDHRDMIPSSVWIKSTPTQPGETIRLRFFGAVGPGEKGWVWDSLGALYIAQYLEAPNIFYCPSHSGQHRFGDYAEAWRSGQGDITGNYQYRGKGFNGAVHLGLIEPRRSALVSDGLRSRTDYSHGVGANVLRADLSVYWYNDRAGTISSKLADTEGGPIPMQPGVFNDIWKLFDDAR
ncbi:MAG: type II secretion system protein [Phycisphaerales bacterium]